MRNVPKQIKIEIIELLHVGKRVSQSVRVNLIFKESNRMLLESAKKTATANAYDWVQW